MHMTIPLCHVSFKAPFSFISVVNKDISCDVSTMFSSPDSVLVDGRG
ncbi:unnamed protein product [Arabidopsis lyrata]|uniref:Uncharacterized protein n=1 Tax=Arabidopsis thaliana x Arabidopsis arenosa TaxID=1240361 RepID=A0A8T2AT98_9BRAS|nr:hypothetical protein ISN45_Aa03g005070 [Arabidopsis thaliana x Arabidopsis arenosa]CAH8271323.1 unnamed protein product [Arabidopsis lyrata]